MGLFSKRKTEMIDKDAINLAKKIYEQEAVYILLSTKNANMISGVSIPYVGQLENNRKILFLFDSYSRAKKYIDKCHYEILNGIYPIGKVKKSDLYNGIYNIFNIALHLGIDLVDYNPSSDDSFGFQIAWFFKINNLKPGEISVILSKEEMERTIEDSCVKAPLRFNIIPIENFENPYKIDSERAKELLQHIFNGGETVQEIGATFLEKESLHENCFVADYINKKMIPLARQDKKDEDIAYFQRINLLIEIAIWTRLEECNLYTLIEKETGKTYVKNGSIYAIYTELFKYMGTFDYMKLSGKAELQKLALENNVERIVVTDGPHWVAIIEKNTWLGHN